MNALERHVPEQALALATELQEAAKSVPTRVENLLALIEPPVASLAKMTPADAMQHLLRLDDLLADAGVRRAVKQLTPGRSDLHRITTSRIRLRELFVRISKRPIAELRKERSKIAAEMQEVGSAWPESRFLHGLISSVVENDIRRAVGETAWLVPAMDDEQHGPEVRERLKLDGFRLDFVSPLRAWRLCPIACSTCWARLRDRLRLAIEVVRKQQAVEAQPPVLIEKKATAAAMLGITPAQLSRWLTGPPPLWARDNRSRFRFLLELHAGCLYESRVRELRAWKDEAKLRSRPR